MNLLTLAASNTKLRKTNGETVGYRIVSLPLAPADSSGHDVCVNSNPGCRAGCVGSDSVGMASIFPMIMRQRREKTRYFFEQRSEALAQLSREIEKQARIADDEGLTLACRLNTFSDLPWESRAWGSIPQQFDGKNGAFVQFYDYSKVFGRAQKIPSNYSICWSWTDNPKDQEACHRLLLAGENVAIVFGQHGRGFTGPRAYDQHLPGWVDIGGDRFLCFDGDKSDLRFLDAGPTTRRGRVCGLRLKSATNVGHEAGLNSGFAKVV